MKKGYLDLIPLSLLPDILLMWIISKYVIRMLSHGQAKWTQQKRLHQDIAILLLVQNALIIQTIPIIGAVRNADRIWVSTTAPTVREIGQIPLMWHNSKST